MRWTRIVLAVVAIESAARAADPCQGTSIPIAVGNHWTYDVKAATGEVISVQLEVVAVSADGVVTVRGLANDKDTELPAEALFRCDHGDLVPLNQPAAATHLNEPEVTPPTKPSVSQGMKTVLSSPAALHVVTTQALPTRVWGHSGQQYSVKTSIASSPGTHELVTPAGQFKVRTIDLVSEIKRTKSHGLTSEGGPVIDLSRSGTMKVTASLDPTVGYVRLSSVLATVQLRAFKSSQSTPELRQSLPPPPEDDVAPIDRWLAGEEEASQLPHDMKPGIRQKVCDENFQQHDALKFGACLAAAVVALPFVGPFVADAMCRHSGRRDKEWEAVRIPGRVDGVAQIIGVVDNQAHPSNEDFCMTHLDRDLEFNVEPRTADNKVDPTLLTPEDGRLMSVEWEAMYVHPTQQSISWPSSPDPQPVVAKLGVPAKGDIIAVRGPFIADCGHPSKNLSARTEIHPPTFAAWLHELTAAKEYSVWIRINSAPVGSGGSYLQTDGDADVLLPMPSTVPKGKTLSVGPVAFDYGIVGYGVRSERGCWVPWLPNAHLTHVQNDDPQKHVDLTITPTTNSVGLPALHIVAKHKGAPSKIPTLLGAHLRVTVN